MSYHKRGSSRSYLVVRRKGNDPIRVVAGEHFRTKKRAEKEAGTKLTKELISNSWFEKRAGEGKKAIPNALRVFCAWKVIKVEGGELGNRKEEMPEKKQKKKRGFLERAVEGITGAFIVYLSASATVEPTKVILLLGGMLLIIYAIFPD